MRYMVLIYGSEAAAAIMTQAEREAEMQAYWGFNKVTEERKALVSGEALVPTSSATTIRVRDGKLLTTDGPFAETKEQLGGFYILECKDLDDAIELASQIPGAKTGSVEIRPIVVWN